MTEDLGLVQSQLRSLATTRIQGPLGHYLESIYQDLCAQERQLLATTPTGANKGSYASAPANRPDGAETAETCKPGDQLRICISGIDNHICQ